MTCQTEVMTTKREQYLWERKKGGAAQQQTATCMELPLRRPLGPASIALALTTTVDPATKEGRGLQTKYGRNW